MGDNNVNHPFTDNVVVLLIAMGSAAFVVSMYHVVAICFCNQQRRTDQNQPQQHHAVAATPSLDDQNISSSVAHLIPIHKYQKRKKEFDVGDESDGSSSTCAVCLGDFEEGEELRSLPECLHSFHVSCIDMWLHSHLSCPICRASAAPSPSPSSMIVNAHHHSIDMTPVVLHPSGLMRW